MRFYSYPPVYHPWVLRNINQKPIRNRIHEIVDIGIYDLIKAEDHRHSKLKIQKWKNLKMENDDWKVVPDCPDLNYEFNIKTDFNTVEYSKELILELFDPENINHLPVIQGEFRDPQTFLDFCKWYKYEYPDYITKFGIGTLCRAGNKKQIIEIARAIKKEFPKTWLHGFGLRLNHIPALISFFNSYDSSAWTFPRGSGGHSCKNKKERIEYFQNYLKILDLKFKSRNNTLNLYFE